LSSRSAQTERLMNESPEMTGRRLPFYRRLALAPPVLASEARVLEEAGLLVPRAAGISRRRYNRWHVARRETSSHISGRRSQASPEDRARVRRASRRPNPRTGAVDADCA